MSMTGNITLTNDTQRPSVLGRRTPRIPTAGKIRAGIKVLTKAAQADRTARRLYAEGLAAGLSFEEIEVEIKQRCPALSCPLVPKNVPWFTMHQGDFPNPQLAQQMLELYGEARQDGVRRLYRFPVIFPADQWQLVMPHELVAWGTGGRKYWSEFSVDGATRHCMQYATPAEHGGRRVVRIFGGRRPELRPDNGGICEPERCAQFQQKQCNLSGSFIFYVPGIASLDAFEIHTNSFYALSRAIEKFETLAMLGNGRISGYLDQRGATFMLTKQLRSVSHINKEGQAERVDHWLIELEAPLDVSALIRGHAPQRLMEEADRAARLLEVEVETVQPMPASASGATTPNERGVERPKKAGAMDRKPAAARQAGNGNGQVDANGSPTNVETGREDALDGVRAKARAADIDPDIYLRMLDERLGRGWRANPRARDRALAELEEMACASGGRP